MYRTSKSVTENETWNQAYVMLHIWEFSENHNIAETAVKNCSLYLLLAREKQILKALDLFC